MIPAGFKRLVDTKSLRFGEFKNIERAIQRNIEICDKVNDESSSPKAVCRLNHVQNLFECS